ncbi:HNH endonuclease [Acaryochloris marina NIES-2412]|uniref:HNH endonuclease n=1 Tax=Acaryochloris marina TaxID=155978 RepID=UPI00405A2308
MATWDEDIRAALESLGGSSSYDDLYAEIERRREDLPNKWKSVVRRRVQDLSSDSAGFKNGKDLFFSVEGLGGGVWGLRSMVRQTREAYDLPDGDNQPERTRIETYRILRDTTLARKIKLLHRDRCQICDMVVDLGNGETYSEAHHIKPLGNSHKGPDVAGNILILCPNHHVLCDYGAIRLDIGFLRVIQGHELDIEYINYHNANLYQNGG